MRCPDDGACHHSCESPTAADCFRVKFCGPLSGVFPDDRWPVEDEPAPEHTITSKQRGELVDLLNPWIVFTAGDGYPASTTRSADDLAEIALEYLGITVVP